MPLWMRLDAVLQHEYARICRRPSDHFLRLLVCDLLGNTLHLNHRVLSPIHILKSALRQADFDEDLFQRVEPAHVMSLSRLKSDIPAIHWGPENVGSSKTWTATLAAAARAHTQLILENICIGQPIIFTEGSALGNPGACGAAAVCFPEGLISEPVVCNLSVSKCSTSYHGELCAIRLATAFSVSYSDTHLIMQIHIFSDCKSAIASSASLDQHICHQNVIDNIQQDVAVLSGKGVSTNLHWVAGHANLAQNELADKGAKSAADSAANNAESNVSLSTLKALTKKNTWRKWQRAWNSSDSVLDDLFPAIPKLGYKSLHHRHAESKLIRVLSGHSRLNNHMLALAYDPCCEYGPARQTVSHILMDCPLLSTQRQHMINAIEIMYARDNLPAWDRQLQLYTLLAPHHSQCSTRTTVKIELLNYLAAIDCTI